MTPLTLRYTKQIIHLLILLSLIGMALVYLFPKVL
jgi:hypothetical protein